MSELFGDSDEEYESPSLEGEQGACDVELDDDSYQEFDPNYPISDARNYYLYNDIAQKFFNEKNSEVDEDEDESEDEEEDNSEEIKASFFGIKTPGEWLAFKKQMENFKSGGKSKPAGRKGTKRRINEDEDVVDGLVAIV